MSLIFFSASLTAVVSADFFNKSLFMAISGSRGKRVGRFIKVEGGFEGGLLSLEG
jgi:hypothetical protein